MQVFQGISIGKQFIDVCDQVQPAVVSIELPGKLSSKCITSSWYTLMDSMLGLLIFFF